jgi:peptide chain release factor 2
MENLLKQIEELRERLQNIWGLLKIDDAKVRVEKLKTKMALPDFWKDQNTAIAISREMESEEKEIKKWEEIKKEIKELEELVAVAENEKDNSIEEEARKKYNILKKELEKYEFLVLFSGRFDENNALLSIHAGTGGVDAQDWAEILLRMYLRFAERKKWKTEILDYGAGMEAGLKNATIKIEGRWSYGYLRGEAGVHRLVRISPFDSEAMRHTSFALVEIIPELPEAIDIEIKDKDLRIDVYRSSGPGGQGVNTTDSAVRLIHKPTNLTVACQSERSQHQNKERALKILKAKLFKLQEEEKEKQEKKLRGQAQKAEWGKQARSYVMQPYQMVKDHRTDYETADIKTVLDGGLDELAEAYLKKAKLKEYLN